MEKEKQERKETKERELPKQPDFEEQEMMGCHCSQEYDGFAPRFSRSL